MTDAAAEVKVSPKIGEDWFNFFRDICAEHFLANPITIGGPGKVVEIDESKFGEYLHQTCTIMLHSVKVLLMFTCVHFYLCRQEKVQSWTKSGWAVGIWRH